MSQSNPAPSSRIYAFTSMQPRLVDLERPIPVPLPLELPVARVEETAVIGLHIQAITKCKWLPRRS